MNNTSINLHYYCSNFTNLYVFNLINVGDFGAFRWIKLSNFSILHCLIQMLLSKNPNPHLISYSIRGLNLPHNYNYRIKKKKIVLHVSLSIYD